MDDSVHSSVTKGIERAYPSVVWATHVLSCEDLIELTVKVVQNTLRVEVKRKGKPTSVVQVFLIKAGLAVQKTMENERVYIYINHEKLKDTDSWKAEQVVSFVGNIKIVGNISKDRVTIQV